MFLAPPGAGAAEDGEVEDEGQDGEDQAGDGADGKGEPENLLGAVEKERNQAEDRGEDGQRNGPDLAVEGTDVAFDGQARGPVALVRGGAPRKRLFASRLPPRRDQVNAGIHRDTAQHYEGCESALVKGEVRQAEDQEQPDERDRN